MVTLEMVKMEAKWGEGLETNFCFLDFLQSKGSKEDTTGTEEQMVNAVCVSG